MNNNDPFPNARDLSIHAGSTDLDELTARSQKNAFPTDEIFDVMTIDIGPDTSKSLKEVAKEMFAKEFDKQDEDKP